MRRVLWMAAALLLPGSPALAQSNQVAFVNTNGSRVVIALNTDSFTRLIRVNCTGRSFEYSLPARSVATFVWNDQPEAAVQAWLTSGDQTKLLSRQTDVPFSKH